MPASHPGISLHQFPGNSPCVRSPISYSWFALSFPCNPLVSSLERTFPLEDLSILRASSITCMVFTRNCHVFSPDHAPELHFCILNLLLGISTWMTHYCIKSSTLTLCSPSPSTFHTQNKFLYPVSLPLSITFILSMP